MSPKDPVVLHGDSNMMSHATQLQSEHNGEVANLFPHLSEFDPSPSAFCADHIRGRSHVGHSLNRRWFASA